MSLSPSKIRQMTWSTIPLKDSHLFKIAELKKNFKQKLITDSIILNKWESFSRMMDKRRDPLEDCIISPKICGTPLFLTNTVSIKPHTPLFIKERETLNYKSSGFGTQTLTVNRN